MGIKSFFRNLGRSIKRGFNNFVAGAGDVVGKAGTFIQQKAVPAIASGATKAAGLLDKAAPLLDATGNPEVAAAGAEASQVLGKVGDVVGKFGKFIGSDLPAQGTPMNEQQIAATLQSPLLMAMRRSSGQKPLDAAGAAALAANYTKTGSANLPTPAQSPLDKLGGAIKPLIGSNPATYSPTPSSGIEAPLPASQPKITVVSGGTGGGGVKSMIA